MQIDDNARTAKGAIDWLPLYDVSASQLRRSIHDVLERHRLLEALRVAQDAADSAQRMQQAFLAAMSDELRTPLNGILGMAELLMETEMTKEQRDYTETIWTSGRILSSAINEALDTSKLKAGAPASNA